MTPTEHAVLDHRDLWTTSFYIRQPRNLSLKSDRYPEPDLPPELPVPRKLKAVHARLTDLMKAYFMDLNRYGGAVEPVVTYRKLPRDGVHIEKIPHPTDSDGYYSLRFSASVDLERCKRAWDLTGGIEAIGVVIVTEAAEFGWIDGCPVWKVGGFRQSKTERWREFLVVRASDGTPIAGSTMLALKRAVRRYNRHAHVAEWSTETVAKPHGYDGEYVIEPFDFEVTNASVGSRGLSLVGRKRDRYDSRLLKLAEDGQWVLQTAGSNVEAYRRWSAGLEVNGEPEPDWTPPDISDDDIEAALLLAR